MANKVLTVCFATVSLTIFVSAAFAGDGDDWPQACGAGTTFYDGSRQRNFDPNTLYHYQLGPLRFGVPWKYLSPRPGQSPKNCADARGQLGIQFWIPDGRAPEKDGFLKPEFRPVESGASIPNPTASIIQVRSIRYYELSPPDRYNPDAAVARLEGQYGSKVKRSSRGDLTLLQSSDYPDVEANWFRKADGETVFYFCSPVENSRLCEGYLDLKDMHLSVRFVILKSAIEQANTVSSTLRNLLQKWEISTR